METIEVRYGVIGERPRAPRGRYQSWWKSKEFVAGLQSALPITLGYLPLGFAYGVLARGAGLNVLETTLMSVLVYAGSAQFIAVSMLMAQASVPAIVFTTFLVNLRHLLMSASLAAYLRRLPLPMLLLIASEITDETFAVASTRYERYRAHPSYQLGLNLTAQVSWVAASWLGGVTGSLLGDPARLGLDYALPAMFIALLVMQLKNSTTYLVAAAGGLISVILAKAVPGNWNIIMATLIAATLGVIIDVIIERKLDEDG